MTGRVPTYSTGASPRPPHVLVVEDHPALLDATRMLLQVEGYRVSTASSIAQAIDEAHNHRDIDLLITDFRLGSARGTDVIRSVRAIVGPLKVLVTTGDILISEREIEGSETVRLLRKPMMAEELLRLIRELLATPL
jgi:CheY-like chemotaxis protein